MTAGGPAEGLKPMQFCVVGLLVEREGDCAGEIYPILGPFADNGEVVLSFMLCEKHFEFAQAEALASLGVEP